MIKLGVNIDHVATIRQARRTVEPDPVAAAAIAEIGGADCITVHVREDRRHMQDRDLRILRETVRTRLNLEMAVAGDIVDLALEVRPEQATLVPEKREEITTEGGLDVHGQLKRIAKTVAKLQKAGIVVSLFVDPDPVQIRATAKAGAEFLEFHTGAYAHAWGNEKKTAAELRAIIDATLLANELGVRVNGGHGLTYQNVGPIAAIPQIEELNIGHSIISRAVLTGLKAAVRDMKEIMLRHRAAALQKTAESVTIPESDA